MNVRTIVEIIAIQLDQELLISGCIFSEHNYKSIHHDKEHGFLIGDARTQPEPYLDECFHQLKEVALKNEDGKARISFYDSFLVCNSSYLGGWKFIVRKEREHEVLIK